MHRIDDAVNLDARRVLGLRGFVAIDVAGAVELDALEAERLDEVELVLDRRAGHLDHAVLDGLLQAVLLLLGGQAAAAERARGQCRARPSWIAETSATGATRRGHRLMAPDGNAFLADGISV